MPALLQNNTELLVDFSNLAFTVDGLDDAEMNGCMENTVHNPDKYAESHQKAATFLAAQASASRFFRDQS